MIEVNINDGKASEIDNFSLNINLIDIYQQSFTNTIHSDKHRTSILSYLTYSFTLLNAKLS